MINLILHTIEKEKEQMFRMFSLLHNLVKDIKENGHHFDANFEKCKSCEQFIICSEFTSIMKIIADSDYNKDIKID